MNTSRTLRKLAAAAALAVLGAGAAQANTVAVNIVLGNFVFNAGVVPALITSPLFANALNQRFVVTFSSECAVNAPAGNHVAYSDVDIVVLNAAGAVVQVLPPTLGIAGAFCSANGTLGLDGLQNHSINAISSGGLPAGNYRVQVRGRVNAGGTQALFGERSVIVTR